jgi:ATP-dependent DNA helicase RecG
MNLENPVSSLNRVGSAVAKRLNKIGIHTIRDLIFYFPFRYEDYRGVLTIKDLKAGLAASVKARIELIANRRSFKTRKIITEALVSDATGSLRIVWFNQPYIIKNIKPGDTLLFSGVVRADMLGVQFIAPSYEKNVGEVAHSAKLIPIYYLTAGLSQKHLCFLVKQALLLIKNIPDYFTDDILERYDLISLSSALQGIHFPSDEIDLANSQKRLKFDELFFVQLKAQLAKQAREAKQAPIINFQDSEIKFLVKNLPFTLTKAQKIAAWEILKDLGQSIPMNRLLSGDVGSGKTVVAAMSLYCVALNGFQSIMMAPTEILAKQHFDSLIKLLGKNLNIALLTRSNALAVTDNQMVEHKKKDLIKEIKNGKFSIILGTHALLTEKVVLDKLALVIVDEQHRFGVEQRKIIKDKAINSSMQVAHFLSMTATPIPRSLALTIYGDLDLSVLDEMPPGRKAVITRLVENHNRQKAYDFIRTQIKKGRQAFVICPLIEETNEISENTNEQLIFFDSLNEKKTVMKEYERLSKNIFPDLKIGYLHGKMASQEKEKIMNKFKIGELDILVSTAVVEVGVDIPNASVMMIEGARRFGLAQLHQFRGRVGRADFQSYCLLFTNGQIGDGTIERLHFFEKNNSGFKLAQKDLEIRGPGEVYGRSQSGLQNLQLANLSDVGLIKMAREAVLQVIDRLDKMPLLKQKIKDFETQVHLE